jgi:hypothetical protein
LDWIVEFKFIPWRGAYAIGLPHLIGGLSAALTGSLRALLDSAHISNSQTMLKLKGGRMSGQNDRIEPTQVVEIEGAPGVDDVRKLAMPLPFNQPSSVLYNLLGWLTDAAKGVVTTAEEKIGDVNSNTPVGTTQALIEQGAKVFSSIHARLHRSQAKSLKIISRINNWYLSEMDNQSGEEIEVRDFAYNNDVVPVSDPNIFSETQRLAQTQALLQMATGCQIPGMFDMRAVYHRILSQLKVPNLEEVLPNPQGMKESNAALENISMTMGRMAGAYPDQDHLAHIQTHLDYAENPTYGASPMIAPTLLPKIVDHIKQHLMLHYLQEMRATLAKANGGEDPIKLHEERPIDQNAQKAVAMASRLVNEDARTTLSMYMPRIMKLFQQVQQIQQSQQQSAMMADPTAQVLFKTQMAETQRKQAESQARMQLDTQTMQQNYQLKIAELQQKVQDLQVKYGTQTNIDNQRNATDIAMANINNAAKERVAMITAGAQYDIQQQQLDHEQNMSALEAINASNQDIRQHGLAVQQQAFEQQAQQVQNQIEQQQAQAQGNQQIQQQAQQHAQQMMQADQQHQQAMQQAQQAHQQQMQQQEQQAQQPQQGTPNE